MSLAPQTARPATPWTPADLSVSVWPVIFGVALLAWGWWEASGSASLDSQTGWVVLGVVGMGVGAFGMSTWVRAGRRAVRDRHERVLVALEELTVDVVHARTDAGFDGTLVTYPNAARYHRPDCILLQGKQVQPLSGRSGAAEAGAPCEMCEP